MKKDDRQSVDVLRVLLAGNIPVKLESLPGAGKTSHLNAIVRASGGYIHTMVAVNHDATDFGGIPVPDVAESRYVLLPGQWARDLADATQDHPMVVLFLDEFNTAGRTVASACLKVVDERRVGNFSLPDAVRMVLAVNPAEANGGVDITPAMANRVAHLPFDFPLKDWATAIVAGFPDPDPVVVPDESAVLAEMSAIAADVAGYALDCERFEVYPADPAKRSRAWPSRRSWTMATRGMAVARAMGRPDLESPVCASLVGREAADEFMDWRDTVSLARPADILSDPNGWTIPERDDVLYRVLEGLTDTVVGEDWTSMSSPLTAADAALAAAIAYRRVADAGKAGIAGGCIPRFATWLHEQGRSVVTGSVVDNLRAFRPILAAAGIGGK